MPFHFKGMEMLEPFAAAAELDVLPSTGVIHVKRFKVKSAPVENLSVRLAIEPGLVEGLE